MDFGNRKLLVSEKFSVTPPPEGKVRAARESDEHGVPTRNPSIHPLSKPPVPLPIYSLKVNMANISICETTMGTVSHLI